MPSTRPRRLAVLSAHENLMTSNRHRLSSVGPIAWKTGSGLIFWKNRVPFRRGGGATELNERSGNLYEKKGIGQKVKESGCSAVETCTASPDSQPQRQSRRAAGLSTPRLLDFSTPKFDERSGNLYEKKGRGQKVEESRSSAVETCTAGPGSQPQRQSRRAAGLSTSRPLDFSTQKFDERSGNVYENKGPHLGRVALC